MSVAEKIAIVEENVPKVYQAGYNKAVVDVSSGSKLAALISRTVTEINEADFGDVTKIGENAFNACKKLTSVIIPQRITVIERNAFYHCDTLASVNIPDRVTEIGESAFVYCKKLTSVIIPDSVTSLGNNAFSNCENLTSVTIGSGVTKLWNYLFSSCTKLKNVTIGSGVTDLAYGTFSNCLAMEIYDFTACTAVPTLRSIDVFSKIPTTCQIKVPASLYDEWIAATNWSTYADYIVAV